MPTETGPTTVDVDAATVTRTILLKAPLETVWQQITVPELMSGWFADVVRLDALAPGAHGTLTWDGYGDFPILITEVTASTAFAFRWNETGEPVKEERSTLPRFTLRAEAGGTVLTVTESDFARAYPDTAEREAALDGNRGGWDEKLDALAAVLEKQDSQ